MSIPYFRLSALLALVFGLALPAAAQDVDNDEQDQPPPDDPTTEASADPDRESPRFPGRAAPGAQVPRGNRANAERVCDDREDDDGDGLVDCGDSDCWEAPACEAGGEERTAEACSDWIDNDGDGVTDCDDSDCNVPTLNVCEGSDRSESMNLSSPALSELPNGTVESLIGTDNDAIGEGNDIACADGIDNDMDGRIDCEDYECRFSSDVTVCQGQPGIRFSVVGGVGVSMDIERFMQAEDDPAITQGSAFNAEFTRLQLRALGSIPFIEDSFFLINARLERSPRITFVLFQVPISDAGHYVTLNSGSGNLSPTRIISTHKQLLLDPPFYLVNAFEQGNGASIELGGPLTTNNLLRFRVFAAGGQGNFSGNVGGTFFRGGDENFAYAGGGQLQLNIINQWDRFDSPFIYEPVPLTVSLYLGGMYSQRPRERFAAMNAFAVFRWDRFHLTAENFTKREFEFGAWQASWNVTLGALLWDRNLFLAADIGGFNAGEFENQPEFDALLRRPLDQIHWRVALHWFWYRQVGRLALLYREAHLEENVDRPQDATLEREIRLESIFRF